MLNEDLQEKTIEIMHLKNHTKALQRERKRVTSKTNND